MKTIYSCVCDVPAKYRSQTLVWVRTLLELAGRSPEELVVHMIGTDRDFERALEEYEVTVVHVPAFDTRRPYSNKLVQLTSEALRECDFAVLCDCDLAFCDDISAWVTGDAVRAKLVDLANPPLEYWRRLFREAGFAHAPAGVNPTHEGIATYANNLNGGLYILPAQAFEELARAWPRWRAWIVKRETLLGPYAVHVFQVAFGLAVEELNLSVEPLPASLNFPTHLPYPNPLAPEAEPLVLHYHDAVHSNGHLRGVGLEHVDAAVERVNALLGASSERNALLAGPSSPVSPGRSR